METERRLVAARGWGGVVGRGDGGQKLLRGKGFLSGK